MKKFTLLIVSMLMVTLLAMAQIKFIVYKADGSTIELLATEVDSIGFEGNNEQPENPDKPYIPNANGHEYVDLGLPSGTLWATMNVGATSAVDYGYYFCWGETTPRTTTYKVSDYKLYEGESLDCNHFDINIFAEGIKKYSEKDKKTVLEYEDDAAHANWGGDWRMPTLKELEELVMNCIIDYIQKNGKEYCRFTSIKNNQSIILPMSGAYFCDSQDVIDEIGLYCSSETYYYSELYNSSMYIGEGTEGDGYALPRFYAQSVRAVLPSKKVHTITFNANGGRGNMSSVDADYAELFTIPTNRFTHAEQDFVCWNTEADGSGKTYMDTDKFSVSSDITLYAQWKKIGEVDFPEIMPMLNAPGKDSVTIAIHVPENTCNGVILVGAGVGPDGTDDWLPGDKKNPFKQVPLEIANGDDRWYSITIAHNDALGVKAIAVTNEGVADWATQWGQNIDFEEENVIILQGTAYIDNTEYYGEVKLMGIEAGSVVYVDVKAWKYNPCVERNQAGIATFTLTAPALPEGAVVGIVGDLCNWDITEAIPMTKGEGNTWTAITDVKENCQYKYVASLDGGVTWSWDYCEYANRYMPLDLKAIDTIESWWFEEIPDE